MRPRDMQTIVFAFMSLILSVLLNPLRLRQYMQFGVQYTSETCTKIILMDAEINCTGYRDETLPSQCRHCSLSWYLLYLD